MVKKRVGFPSEVLERKILDAFKRIEELYPEYSLMMPKSQVNKIDIALAEYAKDYRSMFKDGGEDEFAKILLENLEEMFYQMKEALENNAMLPPRPKRHRGSALHPIKKVADYMPYPMGIRIPALLNDMIQTGVIKAFDSNGRQLTNTTGLDTIKYNTEEANREFRRMIPEYLHPDEMKRIEGLELYDAIEKLVPALDIKKENKPVPPRKKKAPKPAPIRRQTSIEQYERQLANNEGRHYRGSALHPISRMINVLPTPAHPHLRNRLITAMNTLMQSGNATYFDSNHRALPHSMSVADPRVETISFGRDGMRIFRNTILPDFLTPEEFERIRDIPADANLYLNIVDTFFPGTPAAAEPISIPAGLETPLMDEIKDGDILYSYNGGEQYQKFYTEAEVRSMRRRDPNFRVPDTNKPIESVRRWVARVSPSGSGRKAKKHSKAVIKRATTYFRNLRGGNDLSPAEKKAAALLNEYHKLLSGEEEDKERERRTKATFNNILAMPTKFIEDSQYKQKELSSFINMLQSRIRVIKEKRRMDARKRMREHQEADSYNESRFT